MLKDYIKQSGETRRAWAEKLGISEGYLSLILSHRKMPSLDLAVRIENATGGEVKAASFVTGAM